MSKNIDFKIESMRQGGKVLGQIKKSLANFAVVGVTFEQIEAEAQKLIKDAGMKPSFSTVPGYHWATCIMKNDEVCHGIPKNKVINDGDLITIDIGLINNNYHLDTTITFPVGEVSSQLSEFLNVGKKSLAKAIDKARIGNSVYDISQAMEKPLQKKGYGVVYQLTGHGVGEELHMEPSIPCVPSRSDKNIKLHEGQTLAIENMYCMGNPTLKEDSDGWTYRTIDGSISGMFEETVLITKKGPEILTN
ncbi:type I methionyl aminopeptidase [Candidatus Woesebacteria bacterium]|nr:type I methionyl aminopeptidase [Candidatus Woesebacteria bacterium]